MNDFQVIDFKTQVVPYRLKDFEKVLSRCHRSLTAEDAP